MTNLGQPDEKGPFRGVADISLQCRDNHLEPIRKSVAQFGQIHGRRPRVLMSSLDRAAFQQRARMLAGYLADSGFDVDIGPARQSPSETAWMAIENDVHVLCIPICEDDALKVAAQLREVFHAAGAENIRLVGVGDIDPGRSEHLIRKGFAQVLTSGADLLESLMCITAILGAPEMQSHSLDVYIDGVLSQDRRILSNAITIVESARPEHREMAAKILDALNPYTGKAVRIGITGVPGVGKSTFIENFGMRLLEKGRRVAVLAVDPSSSKSGGSILGDKTRMAKLSSDHRALIRPSPSRGALGGVTDRTRETMMVCEAAGFDVIIVETVGVGQSEFVAASMVDFFLLLMLAGAGDQIQGIKKGIVEMADAIAINKADGDNLLRAQEARQAYAKALSIVKPYLPYWSPPVVTCSAHDVQSIDAIWEIILHYMETLETARELSKKREKQSVDWMLNLLEQGLIERFLGHPKIAAEIPEILKSVQNGATTPTLAATRLLELYAFRPAGACHLGRKTL